MLYVSLVFLFVVVGCWSMSVTVYGLLLVVRGCALVDVCCVLNELFFCSFVSPVCY